MLAATPAMIEGLRRQGEPISHPTHGRFSEFQPHQRLAITHVIDFWPNVPTYESTIVVEFFPAGDRVRMVVTLDGMHNPEFTEMQKQGFVSSLGKLDRRFA